MIDNLNLEIENIGAINKANIKINKINVVGGINSSGKSTVGKFLYCFLKSNYLCHKETLKNLIIDEINHVGVDSQIHFTIDDDFSYILEEYEKYRKYYFNDEDGDEDNFYINYYKKLKKISLVDKFDFIDALLKILNFFDSQDKDTIFTSVLNELLYKENLIGFEGYSKISSPTFESIVQNREEVKIDAMTFSPFSLNKGISVELGLEDLNKIYMNKVEGALDFYNDIFYIDTFSILNIFRYMNSGLVNSKKEDIGLKEHTGLLINDLYVLGLKDSTEYDSTFEPIINYIENMVKGHFHPFFFERDFIFSNYSSRLKTSITSSGIKQIGIIQLLIQKNRLKPHSFLIIDEPEVNLHPEWQFRFAEILVLLAKDLDITLYINSHSPMFIESIDAFSEYYNMGDDVNYYLTKESELEGKYDFIKIESNELYKIYDNLGNAYKLVDQLRLRKRLER